MKISTRGRYAIRVMLDLATNDTGEYIPLTDIAKRQNISEKYLEAIVSTLVKSGNLKALRGKNGGYRLVKKPEEYTIRSILIVTEGNFAAVACLEGDVNDCPRYHQCETIKMWEGLTKLINDYFENITLADLLKNGATADDYCI